jgi:hypothetical protein
LTRSLRGAIVWAVVPYVPEAPFFIYRRDDEPLELADASPLFAAAQKGESEFRFLVRGKARPVLVLAEAPDERIPELLALRLVRLSALAGGLRPGVVAQAEELLFYVRPDRAPSLSEEFAVMIAAPVRAHLSAVDATNVLGRLDASELRVVHERFVKLHKFDLLNLVRAEIEHLKQLREEEHAPSGAEEATTS